MRHLPNHVPNRALNDVYMLNYGTIKNTNSLHYTRFFIFLFLLSYNFIKTDTLGFMHIFLEIPYYFWMIPWMKQANNFQKAKV